MKLIQEGNRFVAICTFQEKDIPKGAGFRWNPDGKKWWTSDSEKAYKLINFASDEAKSVLDAWKAKADMKMKISVSAKSTTSTKLPCPENLAYLPYQKAGIEFGQLSKNILIADEMGLGKTIQAIGIINADETIRTALVICPASLKINWLREMEKWLVRPFSIEITNGSFPKADIVIVNYDILKKHSKEIRERNWDILIADECHKLKNQKTIRAQQIFGSEGLSPIPTKRNVFLTGTPIVNRPIELWPIVNYLDPNSFDNFFSYAKAYCDAHHDGYGWDFSGASNLEALQKKLRTTVMIRRLKADVLKDLPAKTRQIMVIPANGCSKLVEKEKNTFQKLFPRNNYNDVVDGLSGGVAAFEEMAKMRREVAVAKAPYVADIIQELIEEDPSKKIILFAHHHAVMDLFKEKLGSKAVKLTGKDSLKDRQVAVDKFQDDPSVQVFIGSIQAAGVGITLTAASHVIFAELDWVPGNMTQAEDRAHRIGQTDNVLIQHIVLDGSLDADLAKILVEKQEVIDRALNENRLENKEVVSDVVPYYEIETVPYQEFKEEVDDGPFTKDQLVAIHQGLRFLAGMCDGACALDGTGFNKMDATFGHSLANCSRITQKQAPWGQKLIIKYQGQLSEELVKIVKGEIQ